LNALSNINSASLRFQVSRASELAFGVEKSGAERNKHALNKFLSPLDILPYDE
jgi:predicted nucleic acid-binding protein